MIEKVNFPRISREEIQSGRKATEATPDLLKKVASGFINSHEYKKAESVLEIAQTMDPSDPEISYLLGITSLALGKAHRALLHLKRVASSTLSFVFKNHARLLLAYSYIELGNFPEAISLLNKHINELPNDETALSMLAYAYFHNGEAQKSIEINEKLLEMDPERYVTMNNLAYTLIETRGDDPQSLKKAELLATKAYGTKPDDPYIADTYGWLLHKLGKYDEAEKILKLALEIAYRQNLPEKLLQIIREHLKKNEEEKRV